jgi:beta-N-acetylhexosaminidase
MLAVPPLPVPTPAQIAGQRVVYSYAGLTPPSSLIARIRAGDAAGVIFFADNVSSAAQLRGVAQQLQAAADASPFPEPLLLMTDQEGGAVRRLPGGPQRSAKELGEAAHPRRAARNAGASAAHALRRAGLDVNLGPVLDVFRQAGNFIDEFGRSFSSDAGQAGRMGRAFVGAQQADGVAATAKHFPGLGAADTSQNTDERPVTLPVSLHDLRTIDERPYGPAIAAGVDEVMASWATYPALDPDRPAGLSRKIIQGELRDRLGFGGVTVTDAIGAGGLEQFGSIGHRAVLAARAGMDLILSAGRSVHEGARAAHGMARALRAGRLHMAGSRRAFDRIMALRATLPRP